MVYIIPKSNVRVFDGLKLVSGFLLMLLIAVLLAAPLCVSAI